MHRIREYRDMFRFLLLIIFSTFVVTSCATTHEELTTLGYDDKLYDFMGVWESPYCLERQGANSLWQVIRFEFNSDGMFLVRAKIFTDDQCLNERVHRGGGRPPQNSYLILKEVMAKSYMLDKAMPGTMLRIFQDAPAPPGYSDGNAGVDIVLTVKDDRVLCSSPGLTFREHGYSLSDNESLYVDYSNCVFRERY